EAEAERLLDPGEEARKARMRRGRNRGDDIEGAPVDPADLFAAWSEAVLGHVRDRTPCRSILLRGGKPALDEAQERLDVKRIVIGRAMTDLHRLPHRLGDAFPGWIDQIARGGARDEDAREIEQQRRVLVAARIEPRERRHEFAAAHFGIADQVEGRVARNEAVLLVRAQQMRAAGADDARDVGKAWRRGIRYGEGFWPGVVQFDRIEQASDRRPDRGPVR